MENDKYGELILNTIDQLRKRKARPDLDRICHMLQRQYGLNSAIVQTELDKLIGEDRVIKVDYKGNTSYRNAAKWSKVKRREYFKAMSAEIAELQKEQQLKQQQQLCAKPVKRPGPGRPRKYPLPNGTEKPQEKRLPGRPPGKRKNLPADNSTVLAAKNVLENKRVKKNYESSFGEITETPDSTIREESCSFCGLSAAKNPKGIYESLLCCTDCKMKIVFYSLWPRIQDGVCNGDSREDDCMKQSKYIALKCIKVFEHENEGHPSCMDYSPELAAKSQMAPWQCMDCKSCAVCNGSGNGDTMLFCDACDKGYHMKCHNPALISKPNGVWMCSQCIDYNGDINKEIEQRKLAMKERDIQLMRQNNIDSLGLPTPCDSPVPGEENCSEWNGNSDDTIERKYPNFVPDPKDWTIDDVAKFFLSIGFADQASAFKEQEIDGKSLLLLKRSDVLTGLSIKLGPALKIYNHVKRLQTGLSIEKLDL